MAAQQQAAAAVGLTVPGPLIVPGPLVVEDVMLLVLHQQVGPPATAATLLHTLGGAVLVDLALLGRVGTAGPAVVAVGHGPLPDALLRGAHDIVARRPRPARTLVPELGAELWPPVTRRLVEQGRIRRERRGPLGLHPVTTRAVADASHEAELRAHLRAVQESGRRPDARTAAVLALLSASGALPDLRRAAPVVDGGSGGSGVIAPAVRATAAVLTSTRAS